MVLMCSRSLLHLLGGEQGLLLVGRTPIDGQMMPVADSHQKKGQESLPFNDEWE